jgi:hypothetical protein
MNRNQFITTLIVTLIVGYITLFVVQSEPDRPDKLPAGVSIIVIDGHEYIKLETPVGSSITPKQNCGGE